MQTIENILRFLFPSLPPPVDYQIVVRRTPPHPYLSHGLYIPLEADSALDPREWYTDFHSRAYCLPHMSGHGVVVVFPTSPYVGRDQREREDWTVARLCKIYAHLRYRVGEAEWCRRLVRSLEVFDNERGLVLEKLSHGPLKTFTLPLLSMPINKHTWTARDGALLALYIRWSLHLIALSSLHFHFVFAGHFNHHSIWMRSDLSLSLTGFLQARVEGEDEDAIDDDIGEASYENGEEFNYIDTASGQHGGPHPRPCVREDLFYWAMFVWRCMTNCHASDGPPLHGEWFPMECELPEGRYGLGGRGSVKRYNKLEDEQLGALLVKVWEGGYEGVEEVVQDVQAVAGGLGFVVEGGEVSIGREWGAMFEVRQSESGRKELGPRE